MLYKYFFWAKTSVALHLSFENCTNWRENHDIIKNSSNRTPVIGQSRDRAPISWQIGARKTNHDQEFCYRYDHLLVKPESFRIKKAVAKKLFSGNN